MQMTDPAICLRRPVIEDEDEDENENEDEIENE
jgi:hypothetical protein